ncbi:hypothetical protein Bca52824_084552 [Brassica carinata]|uniref:Uncharacterized protein n=1 Tax=Brassica carinata TaxID=52824 RepID=A0A8X7TUW6_BRACI|nr:hypothetical protein Bca52824_084552 [Brassica carinata]
MYRLAIAQLQWQKLYGYIWSEKNSRVWCTTTWLFTITGTSAGGLLRECAENYNEAAKLLNSKISTKLDLLHKILPGIKPVYTNVYDPLLDIFQSPAKYGCCGTGLIEVAVLCNNITSSVCPDVSSHVFCDSDHPTEKTYKVVVSLLISKLVNEFI